MPTTSNNRIIAISPRAYIDLQYSGSILLSGATRSGKTTASEVILGQVLSEGPDNYGSQVMIIDPKQAELSRLPHTVSPALDGDAHVVLEAIKQFNALRIERQTVLNQLSEETGDAVKWWDVGMKSSWLFVDEFITARTLFPTRANKDEPDYSLAAFDGLVKRIITMGASAGCYLMISTAEASVEEGGLPALVRAAFSTRILFRPTLESGALLWNREKLTGFPQRIYNPGECWFSSQGTCDNPRYVRFPKLDFKAYAELGRLLSEYYQ